MKLWHSFVKELVLASRSFYFYIEILMAVILLIVLLFVIPEEFQQDKNEYIYWDVPEEAREYLIDEYLELDEDGVPEEVEIRLKGDLIPATLYKSDDTNFYVLDDEESTISIADEKREFAGIVHVSDTGEVTYTYYLQGYETERLINLYRVFHNEDIDILEEKFHSQEVRVLQTDPVLLNDRENALPPFLALNGSMMGWFIIAAYVFLDKQEGVIKAYAVTPSAVWQYLMSKTGVILFTSIVTSLILTIPVMGMQPNYPLMLLFLLVTGFAASAAGLVISSYYDDVQGAFGVIYGLFMVLLLPNISYFIPSWNPEWMKMIPTYHLMECFKEIILPAGDVGYVLVTSFGFLIAGLVLFFWADSRFKKTLTV